MLACMLLNYIFLDAIFFDTNSAQQSTTEKKKAEKGRTGGIGGFQYIDRERGSTKTPKNVLCNI